MPKLCTGVHLERRVEQPSHKSRLLGKIQRDSKRDLQIGRKSFELVINLLGGRVRVLATKQIVDGGMAIGGGDHPVRRDGLPVRQLHPYGSVVLYRIRSTLAPKRSRPPKLRSLCAMPE